MNIGLGIGIPFTKNRILGAFTGSSLSLDFTSGNRTLDPRITFTRASNATVTGPDGTLQYAPHNLLTFSEQFDNAAWGKTSCNITANAVTAPNGSVTADRLVPNVGLNSPSITSNFTASAGVSYVLSVHVKPDSTNKFLMLQFDGDLWNSVSSAERPRVWFDPTTGAITATQRVTGSGVEVAADGSYRVYLSAFCSTSGATAARIAMQGSSGSVGGYTGDGTSGIYLWGAQLNVGSLQLYYPTTVKNLLGYTQEFDNAAWLKTNSFVQTNLLTWSEQFDNTALGVQAATITTNSTEAPNGTSTADTFTETSSNGDPRLPVNVTLVPGSAYSLSIYAKVKPGSSQRYLMLVFNVGFSSVSGVNFDLVTGSVGAALNVSGNIESVGNGWYRCSITPNTTATTTSGSLRIRLSNVDTVANIGSPSAYTGDGVSGLYIWGAQLVQGSTPGDYQRTEGTARAVMYPAPDGTRTADLFSGNGIGAAHYLYAPYSATAGTPFRLSCYVKNFNLSGSATVWLRDFTDPGLATFNLTTGGVGTTTGTASDAEIVSVGDGWFRVSAKFTPTVSGNHNVSPVHIAAGSTTTGFYIWGAQLSDSASLDPYVYNPGAAPAAAAYYGPRFDYDPLTLQPKGLLIEEQRTNSIRNNTMQGAVAGTPGTLPTSWAASPFPINGLSQTIAGVGSENGIAYMDIRISGVTTAGGATVLYFDSATATTAATPSQAWSASAYFKVAAGSTSNILTLDLALRENDSATAFLRQTLFNCISVGSVLTRYGGSATTGVSTAFVNTGLRFSYNTGVPIDFTIRIGMPQLELGAFATSVIPTSGAAATRAADVAVMTGANFSNWYRQDEGTLFAEVLFGDDDTFVNALAITPTSAVASTLINMRRGSSGSFGFNVVDGGAVQAGLPLFGAIPKNNVAKLSGAYKTNDFAAAANGIDVGTDALGVVPTVDRIVIGGAWNSTTQSVANEFLNGHIRKIAYFPRRLSNAELQGITS